MFYIFCILLLFLSGFEHLFRKTKAKNVFFIIAVLLFFVIQGYNAWSQDLDSYRIHFGSIDKEYVRNSLEPIHIKLIEMVHLIDGNFEDFIFIYALLSVSLFAFFVYRVAPTPVLVLSYFFIMPYFLDLVQIRIFLGLNLFFVSLLFWGRRNILFYILYILSVCSHYSMLVFLPFLLLRNFKFYNDFKKSNIIIVVCAVFLLAIPKSIVEPIVMVINPKYSKYLEATSTYTGTVILFFPFFILNNMVLWHYYHQYEKIKYRIKDSYRKYIPLFIQLIQFANYLILIQYFIRDFSRITMNLALLSYIYIAIVLFYTKRSKKNIIISLCSKIALYLWTILSFYLVFLMLNNGEYMEIIERTFDENLFYRDL